MPMLDRASERLELMQRTTSIAIVGMSANSARASYFVATYLLGKTDWDTYFVNPRGGEVLGKPPAGAHRFATLAFVGGFAALGVARAVV